MTSVTNGVREGMDGRGAVAPSPWVIDDRDSGLFRVNRATMVEPEVLDLERRRIFDRAWLYVGHESEVPDPKDFRSRNVGGRPVILCRDEDGEVRVLLNSCTHRGATVCREREGNARFFRCIYHAWTFNTKGDLVALPSEDSYAGCLDRAERALIQPRFESYRGFVFLTFNPNAVSLREYLAGATRYLDLIADQSSVGMRVVHGSHEYAVRANWKLLVENSIDGYHGMPVHVTYMEDQIARMKRGGLKELPVLGAGGRGIDLGNGHAVIQYPSVHTRPSGSWMPECPVELKPVIEARRAQLVERFGPDYAAEIAETSRNLLIFPNLIVIDAMAITIRTFFPITPDYQEITAWELAPADEPDDLHAFRLDSFLGFFGPGGMATPDDMEVLDLVQRGLSTYREAPWSDVSRGMRSDEPATDDELQLRCFWRAWQRSMSASDDESTIEGSPVASGSLT